MTGMETQLQATNILIERGNVEEKSRSFTPGLMLLPHSTMSFVILLDKHYLMFSLTNWVFITCRIYFFEDPPSPSSLTHGPYLFIPGC